MYGSGNGLTNPVGTIAAWWDTRSNIAESVQIRPIVFGDSDRGVDGHAKPRYTQSRLLIVAGPTG